MNFITGGFGLSKTRACGLVNLAKSVFWYRQKPENKNEITVRERLKELAAKRPRFGCPRLHVLLRREGLKINHKKTERIYKEEKLSLRRKNRRKRVAGLRLDLPKPMKPNHIWSMDFVSDQR